MGGGVGRGGGGGESTMCSQSPNSGLAQYIWRKHDCYIYQQEKENLLNYADAHINLCLYCSYHRFHIYTMLFYM